jgi:hypothetical protein
MPLRLNFSSTTGIVYGHHKRNNAAEILLLQVMQHMFPSFTKKSVCPRKARGFVQTMIVTVMKVERHVL